MNVAVADILAKIPTLPADYADHVHLGEIVAGAMLATVDSFSEHLAKRDYEVKIQRGVKEGELIAECQCPTRADILCKHITAFYAVAKADDEAVIATLAKREAPLVEDTPSPVPDDGDLRPVGLRLIADGLKKITEGLQEIVDGMGLVSKQNTRDVLDATD